MKKLEPNDVFSPGKLPINPGNVYAQRGKIEKKTLKSLKRGFIPLVFGEYGVGKTSMVRHILKPYEKKNRLVNIESVAHKSLSDVFKSCLETLNYEVQVRTTRSREHTEGKAEEGELSFNSSALSAKYKSEKNEKTSNIITTENELYVTSPSDSKFMKLCDDNQLALILDELHNANESFIKELVVFIKTYGNANCKNFKIILLGTSSDPDRLVQQDTGIDRLIEDCHLESMRDDEAKQLITEGMHKLNVTVEDTALKKLVKMCVGSPNILQYVCLEASEAALDRETHVIYSQDIEDAISEYVNSKASRLYRSYKGAIETVGDKMYRKQILRAISESDDEYVTMQQICNKVSEFLKTDVKSTDVSGSLRKLKTTEFGNILKDVKKPDGSGNIQNYTTFVDPALKAFIRMQILREQ